jgi:hypothetical protein
VRPRPQMFAGLAVILAVIWAVTRTLVSSSIPGGSPIEPDGVCPPTASGPVPATRSGSRA